MDLHLTEYKIVWFYTNKCKHAELITNIRLGARVLIWIWKNSRRSPPLPLWGHVASCSPSLIGWILRTEGSRDRKVEVERGSRPVVIVQGKINVNFCTRISPDSLYELFEKITSFFDINSHRKGTVIFRFNDLNRTFNFWGGVRNFFTNLCISCMRFSNICWKIDICCTFQNCFKSRNT